MNQTVHTEIPGPRILILFPHTIADPRSGVQKRFNEIIRYLNQRGFAVDLLGMKNFHSDWPDTSEKTDIPGIRNLFLYDHSTGLKSAYLRNLISLRFPKNNNLLEKQITHLPDYAFAGLQKKFNKIIREHAYDYVLISYVQWANLIREHEFFQGDATIQGEVSFQGKTILTMEDCFSRSIYEQHGTPVPLDKLLQEEAERVNLFDEVICISWEEMTYFSAHTNKPTFHYVPVFMDPDVQIPDASLPDARLTNESPSEGLPTWHILFIGSDHPGNKKGMKWFFDSVYPLLDKDLKILCVGKITEAIPDLLNVHKIGFREDLSGIYRQSKVTVNPMLDGTGMKVKVIESMAHGVPVVSTSIGLTGMKPDVRQMFMVSDTADEFAGLINGLITDKTLYLDYCRVMNQLFQEHFSTEAVTPALDRVFDITRNRS